MGYFLCTVASKSVELLLLPVEKEDRKRPKWKPQWHRTLCTVDQKSKLLALTAIESVRSLLESNYKLSVECIYTNVLHLVSCTTMETWSPQGPLPP